MKNLLLICIFFLGGIYSCSTKNSDQSIMGIMKDWLGREIMYPDSLLFTTIDKDTFLCDSFKSSYKIVTYVDSVGCVSCKLKLFKWKKMIEAFHEEKLDVSVLFFMSPKDKEYMNALLTDYSFVYPVCIDVEDRFGAMNKLPEDEAFQTFLLDKENKILAIGNPVHNPKIKELYLKIIQGKKVKSEDRSKEIKTRVNIDKTFAALGCFEWQNEQKAIFDLKNAGDHLLVIEDVVTSCGCTTVEYPKEPVHPGENLTLQVTYKADHPEYFNKTITVHCNAESSPIKLTISGNAE